MGNGDGNGDARISTSQAIVRLEVRAAVAESKNDLLREIDLRLERKADKELVDRLDKDLSFIKNTLLSPDAVKDLIAKSMFDSSARGWTSRERWMGVGLFLLSIATFTATLVLALGSHSGHS